MNITIEADENSLTVIETEHRALILYGNIIGVFDNDHSILDCIGDKAFSVEGHGYLYTLKADRRLYDEWRKFVKGERDTMPKYERHYNEIAYLKAEEE